MASKGTKGNKHKFKGRNNGPARERYWASQTLKRHKVKALMRYNGLTRAEAEVKWLDSRKGRMRTGAKPSILDAKKDAK